MESDGWEEAIEGVFHKGELMGWVSAEGIRRAATVEGWGNRTCLSLT